MDRHSVVALILIAAAALVVAAILLIQRGRPVAAGASLGLAVAAAPPVLWAMTWRGPGR